MSPPPSDRRRTRMWERDKHMPRTDVFAQYGLTDSPFVPRARPAPDIVTIHTHVAEVTITVHLEHNRRPSHIDLSVGEGLGRVTLSVACSTFDGDRAPSRPNHATDEITVGVNGEPHHLWTRRTANGLAEVTWRRAYGGVPVQVSAVRGPIL